MGSKIDMVKVEEYLAIYYKVLRTQLSEENILAYLKVSEVEFLNAKHDQRAAAIVAGD